MEPEAKLDKIAHWEEVMSVTTKRVLFIGENLITSCSYESNPKKSIRAFDKFARSYHKKSKKEGLTDVDITQYLLSAIYHGSDDPNQNMMILDYVAAFRDVNELNCELKAEVAIVFVAIIGNEIAGIAIPWDISPDKFDELNKQDIQKFYMMGIDTLAIKLHDIGKLVAVNTMRECYTKHELIKMAAVHGWANLNENCNMEYTAIRFPIDGSDPSIVGRAPETVIETDVKCEHPAETEKTVVFVNDHTLGEFQYRSNSEISTNMRISEFKANAKIDDTSINNANAYSIFLEKIIHDAVESDPNSEQVRKLVISYVDLHESLLKARAPVYIALSAGYSDGIGRGVVAPSFYTEYKKNIQTKEGRDSFAGIVLAQLAVWIVKSNRTDLIYNMKGGKLKASLLSALQAMKENVPGEFRDNVSDT